MMRIFLDSSVQFSAIYSSRGHSRDLLLMAAREEITLVISQLVLQAAYLRNPERFVKGLPKPSQLPEMVWINPPKPALKQ